MRAPRASQGELVRRVEAGPAAASLRLRLVHEAEQLRGIDLLAAAAPTRVEQEGGALLVFRPRLEGEPLAQRLAAGVVPVPQALAIVAQLAAALREAHARGVLHGGLRPSNVILTREGAVPVDFGVSPPLGLEDEPAAARRACYLAPEQCGVLDAQVDERADVYALGILLTHMILGRIPFEHPRVRDVLRDQLAARAPELRAGGARVPRVVDEIAQRLLRKDPRERYQTAAGLHADLVDVISALAGGQAEPEIVLGARDTRASLTDPAFVMRAVEFAALDERLAAATRGEGGVVLLGAESGGGKTRLLDELARRAQAQGALVLRGQGVDQAARQPFQMLRGVTEDLRHALEADAAFAPLFEGALGEERDALLQVAPELREALGGAAAQELGPEAHGERRSVAAFARLLDAAGTNGRPALVLLDDCQWADEATLKLLAAWSRDVGARRSCTMVVAAFRSEEVKEGAPLRRLGGARRVELRPFGPEDVRSLAESMAGPLPDVALAAVAQLAEGSPFMASAVLRGLVESGSLVGTSSGWVVDPSRMAQMQSSTASAAFLARRIGLLPVETQQVLAVGAVLGKTFDLAMACELSGLAPTRAIPALEAARARHIVWARADAGRYAFVHDKLRETLLAMMAEADRERLHRMAAESLERSLSERAFEIAYHFDAARDASRALPYALRAAEDARARYALELAEEHYRIAWRGVPESDLPTRKRIMEGLGDVLMLRGRYEEAERCFRDAGALATTDVARAEILAKSGELAFKRGDVKRASERLEEGLRALGRHVPRTTLGYLARAAFEALVQTLHSLFPKLFLARRKREGADREFVAIRLYSRLAYAYWFHKGLLACGWAHLREMNLAERYPASLELAQAYSEHAPVMTMVPWASRGIDYAERSLAIRKEARDLWGEGQSLHFLAVILYSASRYEECLKHSREAIRLLSRTGDRWEENTARWHVAFCLYRLGDLEGAVVAAREVHASATEIGDAQAQGIALGVWAKAALGDLPAELVAEAAARPQEDAHTQAEVAMATALLAMRAGRHDEAVRTLEAAQAIVRRRGLRQEYVAPLLPWIATARRVRMEASRRSLPRATREARAGLRAARRAVRMSRFYRNNLPHALREEAWFLDALGRSEKARASIEEALAVARGQDARHEMALAEELRARLVGEEPAPASAPSSARPVSLALEDRFHGVLEVGRRIVAELEPDDIAREASRGARDLLRVERCAVFPLDDAGRVLGESGPARAAQALLDLAPSGRAATFRADAPQAGAEPLLAQGVRSAAACRVRARGRDVAVLYAEHGQVAGVLGADEAGIVEFVAALAGAALENADGFAAVKAAHERVQFQNSLLERQGEAAIDGILVVSSEGKILSYNRRFAEIWRLTAQDVESDERALQAVMHLLEDPEAFRRRVAELYARTDEESREEVRLKDGRVLDRYTAPIRTTEGTRARVWFFRDITALRTAQDALRETNEQLVQAATLKTMLLNTASHELNTPLTPMKLQVHLLEAGKLGPLSEPQQRAVAVLGRNVSRLSSLVRDLLDVSKIQGGHLKLARARVDLAALVADTVASFEESAVQARVALAAAPSPPALVDADAQRVTQVLFNLVSNALKFTPAGGRVSLVLACDEREARVEVRDTGPGLAPEKIARLFQPFSQVHDAMQVTQPGTGLGLYISKGIVEEHGGRIACESAGPGRGSRFWFTIPLAKAQAAPEAS